MAVSVYVVFAFARNHGVPSCVHGPQCCVTLLLSASWSPSLSRRRARITCVMSARDENVIDIRRVRYNYAINIRVLYLLCLSPSLLCLCHLLLFRIEGALPEAQDDLAPTSPACRMGYRLGLGAKRDPFCVREMATLS